MTRDEAFRAIGRNVYVAHRRSSAERTLIILANSFDEASLKAESVFGVSAIVKLVDKTEDPQVYEC